MLAHNHPSGNLHPSSDDNRITNRIIEAARLFDITVLDHIIITNESYYSFTDNGNI
jgi:DNA repair protein RadC